MLTPDNSYPTSPRAFTIFIHATWFIEPLEGYVTTLYLTSSPHLCSASPISLSMRPDVHLSRISVTPSLSRTRVWPATMQRNLGPPRDWLRQRFWAEGCLASKRIFSLSRCLWSKCVLDDPLIAPVSFDSPPFHMNVGIHRISPVQRSFGRHDNRGHIQWQATVTTPTPGRHAAIVEIDTTMLEPGATPASRHRRSLTRTPRITSSSLASIPAIIYRNPLVWSRPLM